jgi:hypothetical protein
MHIKIVRFIAKFGDNKEANAYYSTALGEKAAQDYAIQACKKYYGVLFAEYNDGTERKIKDYNSY